MLLPLLVQCETQQWLRTVASGIPETHCRIYVGHKRARVGPVQGVSEGSVSVGVFLLTVVGLYCAMKNELIVHYVGATYQVGAVAAVAAQR